MRLSDIPEVNSADSTQDEAISNIRIANRFDVMPQAVKEDKTFKTKYQQAEYGDQEVGPVMSRMIASDKETAAAIAPDAKVFSTTEKIWGNIKNSVGATVGPEARHRELGYKMLRGETSLTQEEQDEYFSLQEYSKENYGRTDYGGDLMEELPGMFAGALIDIPLTVYRNPKLSAAFVSVPALAGGALGGLAGLVSPVPGGALMGAVKGATAGAARGLGTAFLPLMTYDAFQGSSGDTYNKLGVMRDESGNDVIVDDLERKNIAYGVGAASATLSLAGGVLLQRFAPILKNLKNAKYLSQLMTRPGMAATRKGFNTIGALASQGGEEGLQEIVALIGEEMGSTADDKGETSFYEGILRAANKIENDPETRKRLAAAGLVGAAVGGTIAAGSAQAQKAVDAVGKKKGLTPGEVPVREEGGPNKPWVQPATDITPNENKARPRMSEAIEVQSVLEFQTFIDLEREAVSKTNLGQKSPEMVAEIRRNLGRENGMPTVWFDIDALRPLASDPEKGQIIRDMIGPEVDFKAEENQLVQVPIEKALAANDLIPKISEIVHVKPELPNPSQIESFLNARDEKQAKAQALLEGLKVDQGRDPLTRAYDVQTLHYSMDDSKIAELLRTQEVADAYLQRLDSDDILHRDGPQPNVEMLANNQMVRERITALKASLPVDADVPAILAEAMRKEIGDLRTYTEGDYINQPSLVDAINKISPVKEAEAINEAQRAARQEISDNIQETAKYEMNKVIDEVEAQNREVQIYDEAEKIKNDPNFAVVDRFMGLSDQWFPTTRYATKVDLTDSHAKPGFSPFAIDPRSLTPEQKKRYANSPLLKKNKAFVRGGLTPDNAAVLLGVNSGENLLKILASTPTREDAIETRVAKQAAVLRKQAEESVDLDKTSMRYAYSRKLENHLKEMEILWNTSRGELKAGIKRVTKALPRKQDIMNKAISVVEQTPIGRLNANQFKIAARKARNKAVDYVVGNDLESAFTFKGAEMLNDELTFQTHKAIGKVNRAKRFFARMESREVQAELKAAGSDAVAAWRELADTFRLTGSDRDVEEAGSFAKYAAKMYEQGVTDITIPDRLSDPRTHISELTVEQIDALETSARAILHQARLKNELIKRHGRDPVAEKTREMWSREIVEHAPTNPDFDEAKAVSTQSKSLKQSFINGASNLLDYMFMNVEHLAKKFDGKENGPLHQSVVVPLQEGLLGRAKDLVEFSKAYEKAIERFGRKEWMRMNSKDLDIPEFSKIAELNYGKLTEGELFMMLLNMGNESNKEVLAKNNKVSIETINQVLNRHLTAKHGEMAQSIFQMYETLWPRARDLQIKVKGTAPDRITPSSFSIGGRIFDGGYYPRQYTGEMDYRKLKKSTRDVLKFVDGEAFVDMNRFNYADDMTRQGHLMNRTGSELPLSRDMNMIGMGFETVIHDLNMRLPIANGIKILTDSNTSKAISSVIGTSGYATMLNGIVRAASSTQMENNLIATSTGASAFLRRSIRAGISVATLAYRLPTVLIQPTSMIYSIDSMGASGMKHLGMVLDEIAVNPARVLESGDMGKWGSEILASLQLSGGDINETQRDPISKLTPKRYWNDPVTRKFSEYLKRDITNPIQAADEIRNNMVEHAFGILQRVDNTQKIAVLAAAYSQFISGDVKGWDLDKVNAMTPEAREKAARDYATHIARTTLTAGSVLDRSEIQHNDPFMMAMFFNDVRNAMANHLRQGRGIKHAWEDGRYVDSATKATQLLLTTVAVKFLQDWARGKPTPITEAREEWYEDEEMEMAENPVMGTLRYILGAPVDIMIGGVPYARDAKFLYDKVKYPGRRDETSSVIGRALTDAVYTAYAAETLIDTVLGEAELTDLSRNEVKSLLNTLSNVSGGIPVNAIMDIYKSFDDGLGRDAIDMTENLGMRLKRKFAKLEKQQEALDASERLPEPYMNAMEQVVEQLEPTVDPEGDRIPNSVIETIGQIESGNKWYAKNPKSTAAGTYQFLEGTWEWIMNSAPELELTRAGRTSADTRQQEKAMRWFTEHNATRLKRADIPITAENLYAAHFLGASKAIAVLSAPNELKIKTLVGDSVMEANDFSSTMSVRSFKTWVKNKIDKAKRDLGQAGETVDEEAN